MSAPKWTGRADLVARGRSIPRHFFGRQKTWPRSKVIRRDPATYQQAPRDVGIVKCGNWTCRLWIASGVSRCPHCYERQAKVPS